MEAGEVANEVVELLGAFFTAEFLEGIEVGGEFGDSQAGEVFEEVAGFGLLEGGARFGDALDARFAGLIHAPILKTAVAPVGEVGFGDGLVIEFFCEEFFGFRKCVEPAQELGALLAVFKALVELVADWFRQLGDFAGASFHRIF